MLHLLNRTRLKAALSLFLDQQGAEKVSVAVKGTFTLPVRGSVPRLADEQVPALLVDVPREQPGASSLKYAADVILEKVRTDVVLVGTARSTRSRAVKQLEASVRVGPLAKRVLVTGDRRWEKRAPGLGFAITEPAPFVEMPLLYERAFGGVDRADPDKKKHAWYSRNPVGSGFRVKGDAVDGTPLPNVEDPAHLITSWKDRPPVAGFGPIDAYWEPRSRFAGTYDDVWLATQAPLLPTDFDLRFFNVAPEGLVANGFLQGGEAVELLNLSKDGEIAFDLPVVEVGLTLRLRNALNRRKADLWTVILEPDEGRCCMVWGACFSVGKQPSQAYSVEVDAGGPMANELAEGSGA